MKVKLGDLIEEYSERNVDNKYKPVAVGKYGIRMRESIYSKELAKDYSKNKLIYKGTLTVGMGSNQIDIGILRDNETYSVSPAYHTYKIKIPNYDYLDYLLAANNNRMFSIYANRGSRQGKTLDLKRWLTDELYLHDEKDQKIIVQTLNTIKRLISQKETELVKLDNLIKARFVEMFDVKNKGRISTLGDECAFYSGTGFPNKYQGNNRGDYPFYKVGDISKNVQSGNKHLIKVDNYINEDVRKVIRGVLIPGGTVVFAKIGEALRLNRRAITSTNCLVDNNAMGIKPIADDLLIDYFFEYMKNLDMQKLCAATTVPSVRKSTLEKEKIYIPDVRRQKQFAAFVTQVDKSKFTKPHPDHKNHIKL